ncbi:MAG: LptF/LptG family permease [Campylobacteraceae bacterium]
MTKLYQRYTVSLYLKNFFVIFFALAFFYVGIDYITNLKDLPNSANIHILYLIFNLMSSVNYVLSLSIVFAMILTKFSMIRSNELVSLYSIGVSKNALIVPIFLTSLFITCLYFALNMTSFANSQEYRSNILDNGQVGSISSDLFLKYNNQYIYFKTLDPLRQEALHVKIFNVQNNELQETITAQKATFKNNIWVLENVQKTYKPVIEGNLNASLNIESLDRLEALKDFRPKIMENVHEGKSSLSILDAIEAISFFKEQGINTTSIKANLYLLVFFPLYAPLMVLILYYFLPMSGRFFNLALTSFTFVFITLVGWGVLFVMGRFSANSVFIPEVGVIVPIFILGIYAIYLYNKNR